MHFSHFGSVDGLERFGSESDWGMLSGYTRNDQ